jgi:hypothetical protein
VSSSVLTSAAGADLVPTVTADVAVTGNEDERLAALHEYGLVDSPADDELSAVVRVAAMVAEVPTASLNLIDENRQCQLTFVGFEGGDSARDASWHGLGPEPDLVPSDLPDRYGLFDATGSRRLAEDEVPLLRALRGGDVSGVAMMIKRPELDPVELTCNASRLLDDDGTVPVAPVSD